MSVIQKLLEVNDEVVRTLAEREQLRIDQKTLQEICSMGRQRITELQAELAATRKQLQELTMPADQNGMVRDVPHYIEAAEVDRPIEAQPETQPQPVQVCEGRWRMRNGMVKHVTPTPPGHELAEEFPWSDGRYAWLNDGRWYGWDEHPLDLVEYLGPIELEAQPQADPEPEVKPYTFAAYIVGDKSEPDALRIVWATEEWIKHANFGIVHRMSDLQFFGNDGGCNITEYHKALTLNLKVQ